jgi:3-hydroxyisobutyrate dehydrogenase
MKISNPMNIGLTLRKCNKKLRLEMLRAIAILSNKYARTFHMNVGFIGLGIMGQPMAGHILRAGHRLTVYNRTPDKCAPLVAQGASPADSPAALASTCDIIITMLPDTPDVEAVLFGAAGVWHKLAPGKVIIDMSTISPEATIHFAKRLAEKNCEMLDAPVSGGQSGAQARTLTIMAGGRPEIFERCKPLLETIGKSIIHMGPIGSGQKTKLVNQVICALNILAMSEGLHLAKLAGLDVQQAHKVVSSGAAASWMLDHLAPRILQDDFKPGFMIKLQQKDLRLAHEFIKTIGEDFPGTVLTHSLFTKAVERGLGEQGTQGLINLYRKPESEFRG